MANFAAQADSSQRERDTKRFRFATPRVTILVATCLIFATTIGCGNKSHLSVAPVHGSVTYKGRGVPGALVIFFPVDETADVVKKLRPFGSADADGKFELKTYSTGDGAPPGKYRVSIVAGPVGTGNNPPRGDANGSKTAGALPPDLIKKYGNVDTSGLQVTVENGENNLAPFTL
jgi:hypothetical protein